MPHYENTRCCHILCRLVYFLFNDFSSTSIETDKSDDRVVLNLIVIVETDVLVRGQVTRLYYVTIFTLDQLIGLG